MKVKWTQKADNDLSTQCDYIAHEDPSLAERIGLEVLARIGDLAFHPYRGRPGRVDGTRELSLPGFPWLAIYTVEDDAVFILRLLHGAQLWPPDESL